MAIGNFAYGGRIEIEAPEFTPVTGGLLDKADVRTVASGDPALRGYQFRSISSEVNVGTVGFIAGQNVKTSDLTEGGAYTYRQSLDPFSLYGAFELSAGFGNTAEFAVAEATRRLEVGEGLAAEKAFWTVALAGATPTVIRSGSAVKPKRALGLIAEQMGLSYAGVPYVHAGLQVVNALAGEQLVEFSEADVKTKGGAVLIPGRGYTDKAGPTGQTAATVDQAWLYASGKPLLVRGGIDSLESPGFAVNRERAFATRTYVPSIDGPVFAVLVDLT